MQPCGQSVNIVLKLVLYKDIEFVKQPDAAHPPQTIDPDGRIMISSVNSLATNAVTVLTGQRRATIPVEPVAPIKVVKRRTGYTDDVFKASNAIGSMIAIASGLEQAGASATTGDADSIDDAGADATAMQTGNGEVRSGAGLEERGMEAIRRHAAGIGPRAEWARAYLEAQEKRIIKP